MFSFRNGIKLLKTGFKHSYPGVEGASVMQNDQCYTQKRDLYTFV